MYEFVRCKLEDWRSRYLLLLRCDDQRKIFCTPPRWLIGEEIGAEFIVEIRDHVHPQIVHCITLKQPLHRRLVAINEWRDRTNLKAISLTATMALSLEKCRPTEHSCCMRIGIHVLDVGSFCEGRADTQLCTEIKKYLKMKTGNHIISSGYKPNRLRPCISVFFHSSLDFSQLITPEASMIRTSQRLNYEESFLHRPAYESEAIDVAYLFSYAWSYRMNSCKTCPAYAFNNTWAMQYKANHYNAQLLIQMCVRMLSDKVSKYLRSRNIVFPCTAIRIKMSDTFDKEQLHWLDYHVAFQGFHGHILSVREEVNKPKQSNVPKIKVVVFRSVWNYLVQKARMRNDILLCGGLLAGYHFHPFLTPPNNHLWLTFTEGNSNRLATKPFDNTAFHTNFVSISRPLRDSESITIQKLIAHAISSEGEGNAKVPDCFIREDHVSSEDEFDDSEDEFDDSEDEFDGDGGADEPVVTELRDTVITAKEETDTVDKDDDDVLECLRDFLNPPIIRPWKNMQSELCHDLRIYDKTEKGMALTGLTLQLPSVYIDDLPCYTMGNNEWKEMQKNLSNIAGEFPFDTDKTNNFYESIENADKTKKEIESYRILPDHTLIENKYQGKPVVVQYIVKRVEIKDEIITVLDKQIITLSRNVHKCYIHLKFFEEAFPSRTQPDNWINKCRNSKYYIDTSLSPTEDEDIYEVCGEQFPKPDECKLICITSWVGEYEIAAHSPDNFVFYAHGENIQLADKPGKSFVRIDSMLKCDENITRKRVTLQFI